MKMIYIIHMIHKNIVIHIYLQVIRTTFQRDGQNSVQVESMTLI